jgi:hypothetical protein
MREAIEVAKQSREKYKHAIGAVLNANLDRLVFGVYAADLSKANTYEYPNFALESCQGGPI